MFFLISSHFRILVKYLHNNGKVTWGYFLPCVLGNCRFRLLLLCINSIGKKNNVIILTGSIYYHNDKFYNSIIALGSKNQTNNNDYQRYMKHHLLPFGEYVPLSNFLRKLGPFFNLPMSDFTPGRYKQNNFNTPLVKLTINLLKVQFPS